MIRGRRWRVVAGTWRATKAQRQTWRRHLPAWVGVTHYSTGGPPVGLTVRVGDVTRWFAVIPAELDVDRRGR